MAFLVPAICLALGADSEEFVGVSRDGKTLTKISFASDPEKWTGNNFIYSSIRDSKFRYCWINQIPIDPKNPLYSDRKSTHFVCALQRGAKPTIFYMHGNYSYSEKTGLRYKEAMNHFKKVRKAGYGRDSIMEYYICDSGCDSTTPLFIFEIAFGD